MIRFVPRFTAVLLTDSADKRIVFGPDYFNFGFLIDGSVDD